jgi:uncharacterized protein (DUF2147 family)
MKRRVALLTLLISLVLSFKLSAQSILGTWFNDTKDAKVEIYKGKDNKYYGKIVWLKEPNRDGKPKVDRFNSNEKLKTRPILGLVILSGFEAQKDGKTYEDGTIYDPKNGKTYSCKITQKEKDKLSIRGYIGISLIGRTSVWTRDK